MIKNVSGGYCMKVMIDKRLITESGIKDFDIDPVKKEIVAVGKKIYFISMDISLSKISRSPLPCQLPAHPL